MHTPESNTVNQLCINLMLFLEMSLKHPSAGSLVAQWWRVRSRRILRAVEQMNPCATNIETLLWIPGAATTGAHKP